MAVRTINIDPSSNPADRYCLWDTADADLLFVLNDVLDVQNSLKRPGIWLRITAEADASVTIRVNSYNVDHPIHPDAQRLGFSAPDLDSTLDRTWTNPNAFTQTIGNGQTVEFDMTVKNVEITALTAGSGVTVESR